MRAKATARVNFIVLVHKKGDRIVCLEGRKVKRLIQFHFGVVNAFSAFLRVRQASKLARGQGSRIHSTSFSHPKLLVDRVGKIRQVRVIDIYLPPSKIYFLVRISSLESSHEFGKCFSLLCTFDTHLHHHHSPITNIIQPHHNIRNNSSLIQFRLYA